MVHATHEDGRRRSAVEVRSPASFSLFTLGDQAKPERPGFAASQPSSASWLTTSPTTWWKGVRKPQANTSRWQLFFFFFFFVCVCVCGGCFSGGGGGGGGGGGFLLRPLVAVDMFHNESRLRNTESESQRGGVLTAQRIRTVSPTLYDPPLGQESTASTSNIDILSRCPGTNSLYPSPFTS